MRAIPTSRGPESGSKGRDDMGLFAFYSPILAGAGRQINKPGIRVLVSFNFKLLHYRNTPAYEMRQSVTAIVAATYCAPNPVGGGGIVMSTFLTGPSEVSGLSNSAVFPTTSTASCSLRTYFGIILATSAVVTFSMPAR